jgi:hypothetical protein
MGCFRMQSPAVFGDRAPRASPRGRRADAVHSTKSREPTEIPGHLAVMTPLLAGPKCLLHDRQCFRTIRLAMVRGSGRAKPFKLQYGRVNAVACESRSHSSQLKRFYWCNSISAKYYLPSWPLGGQKLGVNPLRKYPTEDNRCH